MRIVFLIRVNFRFDNNFPIVFVYIEGQFFVHPYSHNLHHINMFIICTHIYFKEEFFLFLQKHITCVFAILNHKPDVFLSESLSQCM